MLLQNGHHLGEPQSKPMRIIHRNAYELRTKDKDGNYRVIYILTLKNIIIIPHAFYKRTKKTPKKEIELSQKRLKEIFYEIKYSSKKDGQGFRTQ